MSVIAVTPKKSRKNLKLNLRFAIGYELETAGVKEGDSSAGQSGRLRMSCGRSDCKRSEAS